MTLALSLSLLLLVCFVVAKEVAFVSQSHHGAVPKSLSSSAACPSSSTQLCSVPNPLDTLTSGLASLCRLPKGVTAMEIPPTPDGELDLMPKFEKLWDIENSMDCRLVREYLTELDAVVENVIPAPSNARVFNDPSDPNALPTGTVLPRLQVQESDGTRKTLSATDEIIAYLDDLKQKISATRETESQEEVEELTLDDFKKIAQSAWNMVGNILATGFRIGRGTAVAASAEMGMATEVPRPEKPLILYNYEGNQFCRLVREVLTELDIVYEMRPTGKQSPRRQELSYITGGSSQCPYLIDPNTGVDMLESKDIVEYLYTNYARWTPPNELLEWASDVVLPLAKPVFEFLAPLQAGSSREDNTSYENEIANGVAEIEEELQQNPVVIYTYEWSPFSQETKTLLSRLDIPFQEISLGREWIPGLINKGGPQKRAALLKMTGQSSLPHVFIGGKSIGGLFSGTPGLIPALKEGKLNIMVETANEIFAKRRTRNNGDPPGSSNPEKEGSEKSKADRNQGEEADMVGAFE